jgi:RNA polymerase sigma-70 factor (ECF subfamily)
MATQEDPVDELASRAIRGDQNALKVLLTNHRAAIRQRVAYRVPEWFRGTIDPDDVVQEACIDAFRNIAGFQWRGADSFDRWFLTIALRRLRDAIKRQRSIKRGGGRAPVGARMLGFDDSMVALLDLLAGPGRTPSQSVARHEAVEAVQSALADLPEDYRQAMYLVHLEGHSIAAAAQTMQRTERAVENLCYKAKLRMREFLGSRSRYLSTSE